MRKRLEGIVPDRGGNNNADQRRTTDRPTDTANQRDRDPKGT